jgi:hypothetical protein
MFAKLFLSSAIVLSLGSPAFADWQFTKWGMTQEELLTVSPINVKNSRFDPECPSTAPLSSNYEISKFLKFTACYGFDKENDSLDYVYLYLRNYEAREILYDALVAKYGNPQNIYTGSKGIGLIWYKWRSENNSITLFDDQSNINSPKMYVNYKSLQPELEVESKL